MISENVKRFRINRGYSQEKLAEESELSLRTVQRVENGETDPRGDTLTRLAQALEVTPDDLLEWNRREDTTYLTVLNASALSFLLFPLLGIILPLILWITKRDQIKKVDEMGKQLLNFQITWTILLFGSGLLYMIWQQYVVFSATKVSFSMYSDVILPIYITFGILYLLNFLTITINTIRAGKGRETWYYPRINFIR